jgi:L-lactate utilization protein LutC
LHPGWGAHVALSRYVYIYAGETTSPSSCDSAQDFMTVYNATYAIAESATITIVNEVNNGRHLSFGFR